MDLLSLLRSSRPRGVHPVVRELLEQAMDQRSEMIVEFTHHELAGGGHFSGTCSEFDEDAMLVDASLHADLSGWMGETVLVSFKIDNKGTSSYYQFASHLRGLPRHLGGFGLLLETPTEIVPNQKRSFVRISPRKEVVFGIGMWALPPDLPSPDTPNALGVAQASYRQDHQAHLALLNLSAAGLCLKVLRPPENPPALEPQLGDRLLCLLVLGSQAGEHTLSFWLDCAVVNCADKENEPCSIVGLHFNAWAVPSHGKGAVKWFPVHEGGAIGALAAWVLRQQFAQTTRKK